MASQRICFLSSFVHCFHRPHRLIILTWPSFSTGSSRRREQVSRCFSVAVLDKMKIHRIVILVLLGFAEAVDPPVAAPVATPVAFEVASEGDPPMAAPVAFEPQTDEETDPPVAAPVATPVTFEVASEGDPPMAAPVAFEPQTDEETDAALDSQDAITPEAITVPTPAPLVVSQDTSNIVLVPGTSDFSAQIFTTPDFPQNLEVCLLQDVTLSFSSEISTLQSDRDLLANAILDAAPGSKLGLTAVTTENDNRFVYRQYLSLTTDKDQWTDAVTDLDLNFALGDTAQFDAIVCCVDGSLCPCSAGIVCPGGDASRYSDQDCGFSGPTDPSRKVLVVPADDTFDTDDDEIVYSTSADVEDILKAADVSIVSLKQTTSLQLDILAEATNGNVQLSDSTIYSNAILKGLRAIDSTISWQTTNCDQRLTVLLAPDSIPLVASGNPAAFVRTITLNGNPGGDCGDASCTVQLTSNGGVFHEQTITVNIDSPECTGGGGGGGGGRDPLVVFFRILFRWLRNGGFDRHNGKKGDNRRNGRRHRRAAAAGQCQLFETMGLTTAANQDATQQDVQSILGHVQDGTSFPVSTLRSLYLSLLSGLDLDDTTQNDLEVLVEDALTTIDLNGDGSIDALEMDQVQLPRETGDFLFDDVIACTSSNFQTPSGEECVTPDNVVEFMNQFYAGTEVVSADLAQEIREKSGSDACYTRQEFEAAFGDTTPSPFEKETLSAGVAAHQQSTVAWTAAAAGAVGTAALYVAGM